MRWRDGLEAIGTDPPEDPDLIPFASCGLARSTIGRQCKP
jgi:hypothetical protein